MAGLLQKWLSCIFLHLLLLSCVLQYSVSQPENAHCPFPDLRAPPVPPSPGLSSYPIDPWVPGEVIPPLFDPTRSDSAFMPWMPRQKAPPSFPTSNSPWIPQMPRKLIPPPYPQAQSNAPLIPQTPRQPIPPPLAPAQLNTPLIPRTPKQLIPPPLAQAHSNAPVFPRVPQQLTPPPLAPAQSNTPLIPQTPRQLNPPPLAPARSNAPVFFPLPRHLIPPPTPALSNTPVSPQMPRRLIPPPFAPAQSSTPLLPRRPENIAPPFAPGEPNSDSFPDQAAQSGSSSFTPIQLQLGRQPFLLQKSSSSSGRAKAVGTAVGVTLAITIIVAGLSICFIVKYCKRRRREMKSNGIETGPPPGTGAGAVRCGKNLKGLIVDEKGQDMVYWRKDDEGIDKPRKSFSTEPYHAYKERVKAKENGKHTISSARGKSPASQEPAASILKADQLHESQSAGVRFKSPDKEQQMRVQAPIAPESRRPPFWSSGRKGLDKQMAGKENLKPLQREKVNKNADHSGEWSKHTGGSFSYDGDLMEAMFGSVATKRRIPKRSEGKPSPAPSSINSSSSRIVLLDPRRSENIASILRTVAASRKELLDALNEGKGLNAESLEKLSRIIPTRREEYLILTFRGHPPRLAHAESFLYHTMKSVPLAFPRLNAMHFRSRYRSEITHMDENVHILEKGCYELRESELLLRLIEAVLKAGNDMNAGAVSGDGPAFNLTSLWKLFNVQSPDGKTTIIQSVVEEVAISEGKQCILDRDHRLNLCRRNMDSPSSKSKQNSRKFMILGLPLVSGLSAEFPNVKKAASIDYYTYFFTVSSSLAAGLADIQHTVHQCKSVNHRDRGFVTEMKAFLEAATEELRENTEEQMRVMKLVKRTTEHYHSGASANEDANPFQLFATMKEFLDMVDQSCIHVSENLQLQRRKTVEANTGSALVKPQPT